VNEVDLQARSSNTNQFLDLDKQQLLTPSADITSALAGTAADRWWEALDIPVDSHRYVYPTWLKENGADLLYAGEGKIIGFDGIFAAAHGNSSTNWDDWESITPEQVQIGLERDGASANAWKVARDAAEARLRGNPAPPIRESNFVFHPAAQLDSSEPGGPVVHLLTRDQSVTWFFKTREGAEGILQLVGFPAEPATAKIRYKLLQKANGERVTAPVEADNPSDETLDDRLQAATMLNDFTAKDDALGKLAADAAQAGNAKVAGQALQKMSDFTARSQAGLGVVRELAKRGLRKPALEIAKTITDFTIRDQALSELAGK